MSVESPPVYASTLEVGCISLLLTIFCLVAVALAASAHGKLATVSQRVDALEQEQCP